MQIGYFIDTNIPALFIDLNCHYNKMCICAYHTHITYFGGVCYACVGDDGSHLLTNGTNGFTFANQWTNVNYHLLHITYTTGVHAMYNTFRAYHICTNTRFIVMCLCNGLAQNEFIYVLYHMHILYRTHMVYTIHVRYDFPYHTCTV